MSNDEVYQTKARDLGYMLQTFRSAAHNCSTRSIVVEALYLMQHCGCLPFATGELEHDLK